MGEQRGHFAPPELCLRLNDKIDFNIYNNKI